MKVKNIIVKSQTNKIWLILILNFLLIILV